MISRPNMSARVLSVLLLAVAILIGCSDETPVTAPGAGTAVNDDLAAPSELDGLLARVDWLHLLSTRADGGVAELVAQRRSEADEKNGASIVTVPGGSTDALAAALAAAGTGGVVILQAGLHMESSSVVVSHRVTILGQPGSVLAVATAPFPDVPYSDPAIYVHGASSVLLWNLDIQPAGSTGGTAIVVEDSPRTSIWSTRVSGHQEALLVYNSDRPSVLGNTFTVVPELAGNAVDFVSGVHASFVGNDVSGGFFGVWACDRHGLAALNHVHDCVIGIILCKVPADGYLLPSGVVAGSAYPATAWYCQANNCDHDDWGYLIIDGANNCKLVANAAADNSTYDMEFCGDTYRFGFLTPLSHDNRCLITDPAIVVKDCGENNHIFGGTPVDTDADPCD